MARRRGGLGPEDLEIWAAVARSIRPLHSRTRIAPLLPEAGPPASSPPAPQPAPPPAPLTPFRLGERAPVARAQTAAPPAPAPPLRMDAAAFARMTRGKLSPEARIDLHGLTLAEAHAELAGFVLGAQMRGLRLVLVITGKGRGGDGALRRQVPHWLRLPPLAPAVLQVTEAHARHGGAGALYVYLARRRG
jgi:DNA-nicking Smr family endonuclease